MSPEAGAIGAVPIKSASVIAEIAINRNIMLPPLPNRLPRGSAFPAPVSAAGDVVVIADNIVNRAKKNLFSLSRSMS